MIGDLQIWTAALIAVAVGGGVVRLALRRREAAAATRGPAWRFATLVGLQILGGVFLHLTLFPPSVGTSPGRLVIATRGAPPTLRAAGDVVVALPEAGAAPGAIRVPDLGTALRLYPQVGRLRIEGEGLTPRDQIPLDRPAEFIPARAPSGLVDLTLPGPVAPGARFSVAGQIGALTSGVVELLDPAGAVVDRAEVKAGQRFKLSASSRASGLALFDLRLKDTAGRLLEHIEIPVHSRAQRQPRVVVLAGAPSPETKYLRRWAQDAGIALSVEIDVGGGVRLGDAPTPLTRATLAEVDLVVVDDRLWETLSIGERAALGGAARDGLGLLLRPTGQLSDTTRREWTGLGLANVGGDDARAFRLGGSALPAALELNRLGLVQTGRDAVPMIRDAAGIALAAWRPRGQGRVGLWIVADSYALTLSGQGDRYGELWSELFSTLARPGEPAVVRLDAIARPGERAALCAVTQQVRVIDPEGVESRPRLDPATGPAACAAYWPHRSGWHKIVDGEVETAVYVHPADAAPSLAHSANRQATLALVEAASGRGADALVAAPGSPWPWAASLLAVLGLLWWLERRSAPGRRLAGR
ncbi:hypothetical protein ACN2C6_07700 [Caulobacter sp. ErkDOM-YI]|uniref:hypothetical protein n=1 Tax=unclassified Caulobacter TaxID=2648921 RepID=UPI003AF58DCF